MGVLSEEQARTYAEQGYLLVSGLVPEAVSAAAQTAMWRLEGVRPDDPASWAAMPRGHRVYDDPALLACYTPELIGAAAEAADDDPATLSAPRRAYCINIYPQAGEWRWPAPHVDHAIKEHGHKTFPRAFRVACMLYLNDVPPHGAGTIVWPGSHRKLEALAKSDPVRYELMWSLNQDLARAGLGDPVELTPRRGDALFYHYLCAHAGSMNASDRPRFAMNMKW